jgi:SGNH domain-containing protein
VILDGRKALPALLAVIGILIAVGAVAVSRAGGHVAPAASTDAAPVTKTVLLVGDSVPTAFADELAEEAAKHDYALVSATKPGCPATGVGKVYSSGAGFKRNTCPTMIGAQDRMVDSYRPALVIWWSRYEVAPRVGPDGKILPLGSPAYRRAQQASFAQRVRALTRLGAHLVAIQIERPGRRLAERNPSEKAFLVGQTLLHRRDVVNAWNAFLARHQGPNVFSISIDRLVCHDARNACNDDLPNRETARPDGVHYSDAAQRLLAPPIFEAVWRVARVESAP